MAMCSATLDTSYWDSYSWALSTSGKWPFNVLLSNIKKTLRSHKNNQLIENPKFKEEELGLLHPRHTGIPETYGIFYAMGAALMFEGEYLQNQLNSNCINHQPGVLSGCYHVCPTETNFQFDTTFMYCISVLVFLKVIYIMLSEMKDVDRDRTLHTLTGSKLNSWSNTNTIPWLVSKSKTVLRKSWSNTVLWLVSWSETVLWLAGKPLKDNFNFVDTQTDRLIW